MKKHFYSLLFFFSIVFTAGAQIKKGTILLGGDMNFSTSKNTPGDATNGYVVKQTYAGLSPSFGKAIKENVIAGFDLSWAGSKTTQDQSASHVVSKSNSYGAGLFLRGYKTLGSGFSLFLQGRLGGYYSKGKNEDNTMPQNNTDNKSYTVNLGFYPGVAYLLGKRVQVEAGFQNLAVVGYSHSENTYTIPGGNGPLTSSGNNFSLSSGFSSSLNNFTAGVRLLLD